ncbi:DUF1836 domain-containing protein [Weissella confusa]|uniref:DUF1836 domain-containing protein n=1 Tax=Weissella confusa TaxID=1583 RepID=UPI002A760329|nr:DUF1836 domain-containing protein [Weissella confusa]MDY2511182.1 DUF1836 domain-containing protein [Weissella confusa]
MNEYMTWREGLKDVEFPHWEDLPAFDLYMDQVVEYVNNVLAPLNMPMVTSTMINNYVKQKVIMSPIKKKYQAMQIADILIISLMKPVFSLDEIRAAIDQVTVGDYPKKAYNAFVDALAARLQGPVPVEFDPDHLDLQLMRDAANVVFHKMEAEKLLELMRKRNPIEEVPTTK